MLLSRSALSSSSLATLPSSRSSTTLINQHHGLFYNVKRLLSLLVASTRFVGRSFTAGVGFITSSLRFVAVPLTLPQVHYRLQIFRTPVRILEGAVRIPFIGKRLGLSTLLGILPGVGGAVSAIMATYPIILAAQVKDLPDGVLGKMVRNALLGGLLGCVPIVGGLFANLYRPTYRNLRTLERCIAKLEKAHPAQAIAGAAAKAAAAAR
ncbi:hypothetical protein HDU87_007146 [Geranomyces variabilis]|uniref:Uncharacterized protein n=1 Tax=Geranomyces variabilis TaxID=109894 RepID=A0AAD5TE84_9FUNG|nr:hypothetical protein HDU87_007146 [Geranomyces variabilis]